jgi:hypothetical protein
MTDRTLVFQDWWLLLPMQQQSILILACRGPDGIGKFHPSKQIVCMYRASVLKAAYLGRAMNVDEGVNTTFMTLRNFSNDSIWQQMLTVFYGCVDEIPHHYYMHLLHGAEIIGYHHPSPLFRRRWLSFYHAGCADIHVMPESEEQMNLRLSDWNQEHWD